MVTDMRPQTPEETVAAWLGAMVASISAMPPADRARANAALDVHAAMFLMHGVQTAAGATAAHELLSTLLVELLPQAEVARFVAADTGADSEPAPVAGGPGLRRIEIEFPNGGATLTLDQAEIAVAEEQHVAMVAERRLEAAGAELARLRAIEAAARTVLSTGEAWFDHPVDPDRHDPVWTGDHVPADAMRALRAAVAVEPADDQALQDHEKGDHQQ